MGQYVGDLSFVAFIWNYFMIFLISRLYYSFFPLQAQLILVTNFQFITYYRYFSPDPINDSNVYPRGKCNVLFVISVISNSSNETCTRLEISTCTSYIRRHLYNLMPPARLACCYLLNFHPDICKLCNTF